MTDVTLHLTHDQASLVWEALGVASSIALEDGDLTTSLALNFLMTCIDTASEENTNVQA
jgi:hypothetical protein